MKQLNILILFCLFFADSLAKHNIDSLVIRFYSWDESKQPHVITCSNFEYERPYVDYSVADQTTITDFLNQLNNLQETKDTDFCVGCKIFFLQDGIVKSTACLNSKLILINGKTLFCDKNLIRTIDGMMNKGTLIDTQKNYLCGKYGDEYVDGREALFLKLELYLNKNLPEVIKKKGAIRIKVYCKSDQKGNTIMVQPHVYNDSLSDEQNKFVDRLLIRFFKNEIKWKPNDTLMKSDMIEILYKYIVKKELIQP